MGAKKYYNRFMKTAILRIWDLLDSRKSSLFTFKQRMRMPKCQLMIIRKIPQSSYRAFTSRTVVYESRRQLVKNHMKKFVKKRRQSSSVNNNGLPLWRDGA